jgi:arginyl-tRNA synthetase
MPDHHRCAELARELVTVLDVEDAIAVPPHVYLRPRIEALRHHVLGAIASNRATYGTGQEGLGATVHLQFSCPNLNKGIHVGHLRTNFLGMSLAAIFSARGHRVITIDQPSNRGSHIAKAVLAYLRWGECATPESAGTRPDRFVEHHYVRFHEEQMLRATNGDTGSVSEFDAELDEVVAGIESGDGDLARLSETLTEWAYAGIRQTYRRIGTRFDAVFRELESAQLAEELIARELGRSCRQRADGSIFVDLPELGVRNLTIVRRDGGLLMHAQFLGAMARRHALQPNARYLFIMGREYEPALPGLLGVIRSVGGDELVIGAEPLFHGMVLCGTDKMSSRAGGAVAADDLLDEISLRLSDQWDDSVAGPIGAIEREACERLAVALLKYHLLRVPRTRDVRWSEPDLWTHTVRRLATLTRTLATSAAATRGAAVGARPRLPLGDKDPRPMRSLLLSLDAFPEVVATALERRDPSVVVRYIEDLSAGVRTVRRQGPIDPDIWEAIGIVLRRGLALLSIDLPPFLAVLPAPFTGLGMRRRRATAAQVRP